MIKFLFSLISLNFVETENVLNNEYISIALFLIIPVRTIKQKTDVDIETSRLG